MIDRGGCFMARPLMSALAGLALVVPVACRDRSVPTTAPVGNPPPESSPSAGAGRVSWVEGYPMTVPAAEGEARGAVELFGHYEVNPDWTLARAFFDFTSDKGGKISDPVELEFAGG